MNPVQFTRLRLLGFKSFVDPTEIIIAPGLTGVVGPNGCGKSNLLEALRWVMGESRASIMRGEGMEDVIFAGSASRPARNRAEVTLTLDNAERRAPSGFNEADQLEIVRRITRDAGSAYRVNGREARARDIAMLFADASSGAQSPSLVRQGQIAELVDARPKTRRRILEDAAGIAGLYQRRHEAELKLRATEANLERVADVLEAQAAQIAALSRQVRQAARYREVAASLRRAEALLVWRMWRDAQDAREVAAAALAAAMTTAASARRASEDDAAARDAAEARLHPGREEQSVAAAVLQRLEAERDRIAAEAQAAARRIAELEAVRSQLAVDREREAALDRDAVEMSERLHAERASITAEEAGHAAARARAAQAGAAAAEALVASEAAYDAQAQASARLSAEFQAAARALTEAGSRAQAAMRAQAAEEASREAAARDCTAAQGAAGGAREAAEATAQAAHDAEAALTKLEAASQTNRTAEAATRASLAEAEGGATALNSEAAALDRLLVRPVDAPAQVLDDLTVTPGYELALAAALSDDLSLPALEDDAATGWRRIAGGAVAAALPEGAQPLGDHVRGAPALARRLAAIGMVDRAEGARLQAALAPGHRIVSREGDLWRWDGLALAAVGAADAAAHRLQQRNRLTEMQSTLAAAQTALAEALDAQRRAAANLAAVSAREAVARVARRSTEQAATEAVRLASRAEAALEALRGRLASLRDGCTRRTEDAKDARVALAAAEAAHAVLVDPAAARAALDAERLRVEAARLTMLTRRAEADEIERGGLARQKRLAEIARELPRWSDRHATADIWLADLTRRAEAAAAALEEARDRPRVLAAQRLAQEAARETAQARSRQASEALAQAEAAFRSCERAARDTEHATVEAREARARAEALAEAAEGHALTLAERVRSELEAEPDAILAEHAVAAEAVPDTATLERQVAVLRTSRDGLGAVNLRAEEDVREIEAERETLARDRADLEAAIKTLRQGIGTLNREGRTRLLSAFDAVNRNFSALFRHLFGGGEASLVLVESDDPLEAGLEIMCQPPGKKLSTLSLLSGGEQTLTALSLIFAVFLANPSPICVLDEVDAPLDDANVMRFCDLLDEMTARTATRFLIITHHAVTMARMDRLFGATMAEPGVSQLVSVDLAAAERLVDAEA